MRQQYGAGASFWNTDEGKDLLLDTMSNQYTGDQAGLPEFLPRPGEGGPWSIGHDQESPLATKRAAQWLSGPRRIQRWLFGSTTSGSQTPTQALVLPTKRSRRRWKPDSFLLLRAVRTRLVKTGDGPQKQYRSDRVQPELSISSGNQQTLMRFKSNGLWSPRPWWQANAWSRT